MYANYFEWVHVCVLKLDDGVVDPIVDKPPQVVGERKVEEILQSHLPLHPLSCHELKSQAYLPQCGLLT